MTMTPVMTASGVSGIYQHLFPDSGSPNHGQSQLFSRRHIPATRRFVRPFASGRVPAGTATWGEAARPGRICGTPLCAPWRTSLSAPRGSC